jgi:hypothetical protein
VTYPLDPLQTLDRALNLAEQLAAACVNDPAGPRFPSPALDEHYALWEPRSVQGFLVGLRRVRTAHAPAPPPYNWLCQMCGDEGQHMDCTYPCDTLRLLAQGAAALLGWRA